jgi:DNA-binding response OmpR family regulator
MDLVAMVLLVEDDPSVREGLGLALRRQGHEVRAAETGEEGVARLRESRPDIVVLDIMLPGIDGFETCRRMRAHAEVPIIMLTARGDDFDVVAGLEAGADDYVGTVRW